MPTLVEEEEVFKLATTLYHDGQFEQAFKLFLRLATDFNKGGSQRFVGWMYFCGEGVAKDIERASYWFEMAANRGDLESMFGAGRASLLRNDFESAFAWFKLACEQGFAPACFRLGQMHEFGQGCKTEPDVAFRYYDKGYSDGNLAAGLAMARQLLKGDKGQLNRIRGALMYAWLFILVCRVALNDSNSPRFLR